MICAGASEQGMSQWASAFAESGLHVGKRQSETWRDHVIFALLMGSSRLLYAKMSERISLPKNDALKRDFVHCELSACRIVSKSGAGAAGMWACGFLWAYSGREPLVWLQHPVRKEGLHCLHFWHLREILGVLPVREW